MLQTLEVALPTCVAEMSSAQILAAFQATFPGLYAADARGGSGAAAGDGSGAPTQAPAGAEGPLDTRAGDGYASRIADITGKVRTKAGRAGRAWAAVCVLAAWLHASMRAGV